MVKAAGYDATIRIGSNVAGALSGIMGIRMGMKNLDKTVMTSAAIVGKSALIMTAALGAVGIAGAIGVKKATDNFREFEQSAVNAASVAGKVGDEFVAIKDNVMEMSKELGRTTKFTAGITADALYDVASAGYDVGNMITSEFKPVMDLAAGTQSELARTTHWVTSVLGQFNLEMEDSGRVADVFAMTIGSSKATLEKMGLAFNYAGSAAYAFGDDIETVGAILALMYNRGLRGEQAGRALAAAYADLADPTAKALSVLKELGLTADDVNPSLHSMAEILGLLADRGIDANQSFKLFGKEGAKGTLAAMGDMEHFLILNSKLLNSTGFAALLAAEQLDTLKGTTQIFHSALEVLSIEIGEFSGFYLKGLNIKLTEIVNVMIDMVEPAFVRLQELLDDLSPTFTAIRDSVERLKGIFEDLADALGFTDDSFDKLVDSVNIIAVSIALVLNFIDKHPNIVKFALAIAFAAAMFVTLVPAITAVLTIGGYLIIFITGLGTILGALTTFLVTGFIPAWVGAWLAALGPITLVAAAISVLAALWVFDIGGMRDITKTVFEEIGDMFWSLVDKMIWFINKSIDLGNKLRELAGKEPIEIEFDVENSKGNIERGLKQLKLDALYPSDSISMDFLDSTQQSADYIARESAEFMKNTMEVDRNTEAIQNNILAKGNYGDGSLLSGRSTEQANLALKYGGEWESGRTEYTREQVSAGRASGDIKSGDTYFIVDSITTSSDVDNLDERMSDARESVE